VSRGGQEHRKAPRQPVFGHAIVRGPDFEADCIIRDLSATGARLQVSSSIQLPEEFNLLLLEAKTSRHVVLKWRTGDFAGVAFCGSDEAVAPGPHTQPEPGVVPPSLPAGSPPPPSTRKTGPDQRLAPRRDVLGHCLVVAPGLKASAVIRDISTTGAKLAIHPRIKLPPEFHIVDPKTNSARRVTLRWRNGDFAGVQFCKPPPHKTREANIWHV
jgi:hypothetical protein